MDTGNIELFLEDSSAAISVSAKDGDEESIARGAASVIEVLRHKRFEDCTPTERAAIEAMIARIRLSAPLRRSRREVRSRRGGLDMRRTLRGSLRYQGELVHRAHLKRKLVARRLVLLLDVSGSMAVYSRALLLFGHAVSKSGRHVEVFCFGTRLTRVTSALRHHRPDEALDEAARQVADWEGGTRIGESIAEFLTRWGRHVLSRGAIVVVCSDGLERGDPERLASQMARLGRLAHRVVWVNPLKGFAGYQPLARGMRAALPHLDAFLPGHDLASLEDLAELLPRLSGSPSSPD